MLLRSGVNGGDQWGHCPALSGNSRKGAQLTILVWRLLARLLLDITMAQEVFLALAKKKLNAVITNCDAIRASAISMSDSLGTLDDESKSLLICTKIMENNTMVDDLDGINNFKKEVLSLSRRVKTITRVTSNVDEESLSFLVQIKSSDETADDEVEEPNDSIQDNTLIKAAFRMTDEDQDEVEVDDLPKILKPKPSTIPEVSSTQFSSGDHKSNGNSITNYAGFEKFGNKAPVKRPNNEPEQPNFQRWQNPKQQNGWNRNSKLSKYKRQENSDSDDQEIPPATFQSAHEMAYSNQQNRNGNGERKYGSGGSKYVPPVKTNTNGISKPAQSLTNNANPTKHDWVLNHDEVKTLEKTLVEKILSEIVDDGRIKVKFEDIAGLETVKKRIEEIVVHPMLRPDLYKGIRSPGKGVLLFGPPGTGKSMIGKCVASHSNATFFSISASVLTSKWVGDGEKMVRALFSVARVMQPTVIFIDEIDSLLLQRNDSDHECSRRMKTEFLLQFDGMSSSEDDRLLVIGATNHPQGLDEAARRRFTKRLYIPLPEKSARIQIIEKLFKNPDARHVLDRSQLEDIGDRTEGYSGADVNNLCREAAMRPLRRSIETTNIISIKSDTIDPISHQDFIEALEAVKSSVSPQEITHYEEFNRLFGAATL